MCSACIESVKRLEKTPLLDLAAKLGLVVGFVGHVDDERVAGVRLRQIRAHIGKPVLEG